MTPDTWGISGPRFLAFYLGAVVAVTVAAGLHRRFLAGGRTTDLSPLGAQEIAYLTGGNRMAVYSAMAGLRAAGAIGCGPDRTLEPTGPLPSGVTPLDTAVYNAAGRRIRSRDVLGDEWVAAALDQLRQGLEQRGLATTAGRRRRLRLWAIAAAALVVLGIARLVAGVNNGKPVGFLVPSIVLAVIVTVVILVRSARVITAAATRRITELRRQSMHLSPSQSPSYATYGASGAAMGVALFGAPALMRMDPAFASQAQIIGATSGWSSAGSGSWSGSSSSCSSGSSCGGGGGCGGGGCGG